MEAKGEISMRMVHCEDCGKRYDYDVDGFCPRCGAFNQPVWVRSGGTAAAAESPASCHNPQTWLLNGSEVVIAVASDVVGFHEDIVFLLIPHQLAIHLGE